MPYTPTVWENRPSTATPVSAGNLNKMENGIALGVNTSEGNFGVIQEQLGVTDSANSWWCQRRAIYNDLRKMVYVGGVSSVGTMNISTFDLRRNLTQKIELGTYEVDDHNVPAFLIEEDKPPLVALVRHAVESFVRVRIGKAPYDVASLGTATEIQVPFPAACTYAHLIRKPGTNTIALLTRNADGWYVSVSNDYGLTWGAAVRFHGLAYATFKQVGNGTIQYVVTTHPITSPNNAIRYFSIDPVSGAITNAAGLSLGNLWSFTTVISANDMTRVSQVYDVYDPAFPDRVVGTNRTFDVAPGGSIAAMRFKKETSDLGGMYGVYRYSASNDWVWEPIVESGVPVGYYQSSYVGGMVFGSTDDIVWIARESSGTWTMERWAKSGGSWSKTDTLATRTNGEKLGRPQIPWGSEGKGLLLGIDYFRYPIDSFSEYYGDQRLWKTNVFDPVTPPDVTPPSVPGSLSSTPGANSAVLTWAASTDAVGVTGYEIYNGFDLVRTVTGLTTTVTGLTAGTPYYFRVRAVDAAGNKSTYGRFPAVTPSAVPLPSSMLTTGSVLLIDPTHPTEQWATGVPTGTVPNLARTYAQAMAGTGVAADFNMTVTNTLTSTDAIVERTGKNALHVIMSQSVAVADHRMEFSSAALQSLIAANASHSWYIGVWATVTRVSTRNPPVAVQRLAGFLTSANGDGITARLATGQKLTVAPSSNRTNIRESATPVPIGNTQRVNAGYSSLPSLTGGSSSALHFGSLGSLTVNQEPSQIIYRVYMEDLTFSGRSYASVDARDEFEFNEAFASGGRYFGDTYTAVTAKP